MELLGELCGFLCVLCGKGFDLPELKNLTPPISAKECRALKSALAADANRPVLACLAGFIPRRKCTTLHTRAEEKGVSC